MRSSATATLLAIAGTALAQPAITIEVESPVLMPGESTLVTMWAGYGGTDFAVAGLETSLLTSVGSDGWSDPVLIPQMDGPGTTAGTASVTGYDGIVAGQLHRPFESSFAVPDNPIAFWQATYTAPTDVAAPVTVDLSTMTARYVVWVDQFSPFSESRLDDLTEGAATIRVVPTPASALVLAGGVLAMRRRR